MSKSEKIKTQISKSVWNQRMEGVENKMSTDRENVEEFPHTKITIYSFIVN